MKLAAHKEKRVSRVCDQLEGLMTHSGGWIWKNIFFQNFISHPNLHEKKISKKKNFPNKDRGKFVLAKKIPNMRKFCPRLRLGDLGTWGLGDLASFKGLRSFFMPSYQVPQASPALGQENLS